MTAAIPDAVKQIGSEAGIALRFALADIAPHEAAALWSRSGAIELVNEAFARALQAERNMATEAGYLKGLNDAAEAIHCGCTNHCDFDEAEETIRDLIAACTPKNQPPADE